MEREYDAKCPRCFYHLKIPGMPEPEIELERWREWFGADDPADVAKARPCRNCKRLEAEVERLEAIERRVRAAELSQCGFEGGEDIVLLNRKPIGGTITKHSREFDRWWPAVRRVLLGEAKNLGFGVAEAAEDENRD